jgi:hypothetical protein
MIHKPYALHHRSVIFVPLYGPGAKFLVLTHAWSGHAYSAERDKSDAPLRCYPGFTQFVPVNVADRDSFLNLPATRPHVSLCGIMFLAEYSVAFKTLCTDVTFEVPTTAIMNISIFWGITPRSSMKIEQRLGGTLRLLWQACSSERSVDLGRAAQCPRRWKSLLRTKIAEFLAIKQVKSTCREVNRKQKSVQGIQLHIVACTWIF